MPHHRGDQCHLTGQCRQAQDHDAGGHYPASKFALTALTDVLREELRPVRLQLELLKPQMIMDALGVRSTIVMFGGARIPAPEARAGARTLLLTHNVETVGAMSCNPAIGGIGKGHLVKEVDALGGAMALATDEGGIQFRILNSSKGPAVRATRAQADRVLYKAAIRRRLENQPRLWIFQQAVEDLMLDAAFGQMLR